MMLDMQPVLILLLLTLLLKGDYIKGYPIHITKYCKLTISKEWGKWFVQNIEKKDWHQLLSI